MAERIPDLMKALEESVEQAKSARDRKLADDSAVARTVMDHVIRTLDAAFTLTRQDIFTARRTLRAVGIDPDSPWTGER